MTLVGLLGLKPVAETVRDLLEMPPIPGQAMPNANTLWFTRIVELVFEASPESLIQTVALLATPAEQQTDIQCEWGAGAWPVPKQSDGTP